MRARGRVRGRVRGRDLVEVVPLQGVVGLELVHGHPRALHQDGHGAPRGVGHLGEIQGRYTGGIGEV